MQFTTPRRICTFLINVNQQNTKRKRKYHELPHTKQLCACRMNDNVKSIQVYVSIYNICIYVTVMCDLHNAPAVTPPLNQMDEV